MTFRTFEEWIAVAFHWLPIDCRDALNLRAAWEAGQRAALEATHAPASDAQATTPAESAEGGSTGEFSGVPV